MYTVPCKKDPVKIQRIVYIIHHTGCNVQHTIIVMRFWCLLYTTTSSECSIQSIKENVQCATDHVQYPFTMITGPCTVYKKKTMTRTENMYFLKINNVHFTVHCTVKCVQSTWRSVFSTHRPVDGWILAIHGRLWTLYCTTRNCTQALYCTALHCIALHCTV